MCSISAISNPPHAIKRILKDRKKDYFAKNFAGAGKLCHGPPIVSKGRLVIHVFAKSYKMIHSHKRNHTDERQQYTYYITLHCRDPTNANFHREIGQPE